MYCSVRGSALFRADRFSCRELLPTRRVSTCRCAPDPQAALDSQRRHAELKLIKTNMTSDPIRQGQLPEAIALCKTWMNDRGLRTIPERQILTPMLEVQGIKVSYNNLITALRQEGYSF